jgi:hypothetical protein
MILLAVKRLGLRKHLESSKGDESFPEQLGLWKVLAPKNKFRDEDEKDYCFPLCEKSPLHQE